jgi:hypothetical protein
MRRCRARAWAGGAILVAVASTGAGCAQRSVVAGPTASLSAIAWAAIAVVAGGAVLAVATLVHPARPVPGSGLAAAVLAIQTGAVVVVAALLVGAALRNAGLIDRADDGGLASSLVRLSDLDGRQASFFYVLAGLVAVLGLLLAVVLGLAARSAAAEEAVDRGVATGVLVLECLASGVAWGLLLAGWRGPEVLVGALLLPVLVLAARSCWPSDGAGPSPSATTGP